MASRGISWGELISELEDEFSGLSVDIDRVKHVMQSYRSCEGDWKQYAKFDRYRYTRNLVNEGNEKFNLIILCWNEGQGSSIHDHSDSHCFMKVLCGDLKETMYDWPSQEQKGPLKQKEQNTYHSDDVAYIDDSIGLHRVENPSHTENAVSLHLYSPPFCMCQTFDERSAKKNVCRVVFHSKNGQMCQPL